MSDEQLWYVAGQIDGDGSVGVYGDANCGRGDGTLTVSIGKAENSLHVLQNLQKTFGGRVQKNRDAHDQYQAMFSWVKTGQDAVKFCLAIKDYVQLKKKQFELASSWYARPTGGQPFILTHPSFNESYYDSMTSLCKDTRFQITTRQAARFIAQILQPTYISWTRDGLEKAFTQVTGLTETGG